MKKQLLQNISLLIGTIIGIGIMLYGVEVACSLLGVPLLGTSKNLFLSSMFGESRGNTPNTISYAFGKTVYTDAYGFRVSQDYSAPTNYTSATLVLGDSVAFGVGVEDDKTFVGLLRDSFPQKLFYNSSVIGYSTKDYFNVVSYFLPHHSEISNVILVMCLNDVSPVSAEKIVAQTALNGSQYISGSETYDNFVFRLKQNVFLRRINNYIRTQSRFYVFLKNILTNTRSRYWRADKRVYTDDNNEQVYQMLKYVRLIHAMLEEQDIRLSVVVVPFAAQFSDNDDPFLPQRIIGDYFKKYGIVYIDCVQNFRNYTGHPEKLFLPYDPMHLSEDGHRCVFRILKETGVV